MPTNMDLGKNQDPSLSSYVPEDWPGDIIVNIEYISKIKGYEGYKDKPYAELHFTGHTSRDIYRVNEHLSVLVAIVCNCLVIAVFVRILGLARLPSRIIVSMALANIAFALTQSLHTASVSVKHLADSENNCRFITLSLTHAWTLQYNGLSAAILERILACNCPAFYSRNISIIGPAILITPWAFWAISLVLIIVDVYDFDLGYECSSHMNNVEPVACMYSSMESAILLVFILFGALGISFLLDNQSSSDVWETNRMRFEVRTTIVILKVALMTTAFAFPLTAYSIWIQPNGVTSAEAENLHLVNQFSTHLGMSLICVLLSRQEFRRHLPLIFEGQAAITRTRTHNLLINHPGSEKSYAARAGLNKAPSETRPEPRGPLTAPRAASSLARSNTIISEQSGLRSRELPVAADTPDWLMDSDNDNAVTIGNWPLSGLFGKWFQNDPIEEDETTQDTSFIGIPTRDEWTADYTDDTGA